MLAEKLSDTKTERVFNTLSEVVDTLYRCFGDYAEDGLRIGPNGYIQGRPPTVDELVDDLITEFSRYSLSSEEAEQLRKKCER